MARFSVDFLGCKVSHVDVHGIRERLLADGHDPMAVRLAILAHHYREDWDWTAAGLAAAADRLARWREAVRVAGAAASLPAADAVLVAAPEWTGGDAEAAARSRYATSAS